MDHRACTRLPTTSTLLLRAALATAPKPSAGSLRRLMGCAGSRLEDPGGAYLAPAPAGSGHDAALAVPPLPHGHHLLGGLARALELEYGTPNEAGAVATWVTLELEMRPTSHFDELGTDLRTCCDFCAAVERAVREKAVTTASLREKWGCRSERPLMSSPAGPVTLADVAPGSSPDSWRLRANVPSPLGAPRGHKVDLETDDIDSRLGDSTEDEEEGRRREEDPDGFAGGDGRFG